VDRQLDASLETAVLENVGDSDEALGGSSFESVGVGGTKFTGVVIGIIASSEFVESSGMSTDERVGIVVGSFTISDGSGLMTISDGSGLVGCNSSAMG